MFTQLQPKGSVTQPAAAAIWHLGSVTGIEKQKEKEKKVKIKGGKKLKSYVRLTTTKTKFPISSSTKGFSKEISKFCCCRWSLRALHAYSEQLKGQTMPGKWVKWVSQWNFRKTHSYCSEQHSVPISDQQICYLQLHLQRLPLLIHAVGLRVPG